MVGPMPPTEPEEDQPRKKPRKALAHEKLYLQKLPNCQMYERSFMHRDTITHLILTESEFIVTASSDGHLKFWKKFKVGIEFVKHFRAHLGTIEGLAADADGLLLATTSNDKSLKVYDVINFDMINMMKLPFSPTVCEWIHKKGAANALVACAEEGCGNIYIYQGRGEVAPLHTLTIHTAPVTSIKFVPALNLVLSSDTKGMIEYWSADEEAKFAFPKNVAFEFKSDTDLYELAKNKAFAHQISVSPTHQHFALTSSDRKIRIFELVTGKLYRVYDESIDYYQQAQQAHPLMPAMEFGRRIAGERELTKSMAVRRENAVFDETGFFILYPSLVGVKVVNIRTNTCVRVIGKGENIRLVHLSLFQPQSQKTMLSIQGIDNPNMQSDEPDPTLFCTSYKKNRFYLFTTREPEDTGGDVSRDTFNEKPTREEQMTAAGAAPEPQLAASAIIHTTMGDITVTLHPKEAPKAVENFVGLSRKNYYNGCIFHRVIKNFMVQTGDPRGDGSGGESIWGYEFEDEFHPSLRHDRAYVLSMANAGRNTNGSQFFITVVPTPWLDNKHTIFGVVTKGMEVAHSISVVKTDPKTDKPYDDIKIVSVTIK